MLCDALLLGCTCIYVAFVSFASLSLGAMAPNDVGSVETMLVTPLSLETMLCRNFVMMIIVGT